MFYELLPTHASTWEICTYIPHASLLHLDECSKNNGGCHHICVNRPTGPICKCNQGYVLQGGVCYGEEGIWKGRGGEGERENRRGGIKREKVVKK